MEHENTPENTLEQEQSQPLFFGNFGSSPCFADMLALIILGGYIGWGSKPTQQASTYPTKHRPEHIFLTKTDLARTLNISVGALTSRLRSAKKRKIKIATAYYGARPHYSIYDVIDLCKPLRKDKP